MQKIEELQPIMGKNENGLWNFYRHDCKINGQIPAQQMEAN
jgi:hypothetical protein